MWLSGGCSAMHPPPAKPIWQRGLGERLTIKTHMYRLPPPAVGSAPARQGLGNTTRVAFGSGDKDRELGAALTRGHGAGAEEKHHMLNNPQEAFKPPL